jgi:exo-beta-1,3-glucanase (GH17 family)
MTGYSVVRIYGTDCNQVGLVTAQAAQRGMKVFVGIGDPTVNIASAVQEIINQAGSNLDVVDTIGVGNEFVGTSGGAVSVVTAAIGAARTALSGIFTGSIVTVDTCGALAGNPALCAASDYCAANCHAFFSANTAAAGAGADIQNQVAGVVAANPGKSVVVTESGWAWKDPTGSNPKATPDQHAAAISSLRAAFSSNLFLFQAFDTIYKPYGTEQYFGIYDHND